MKRNFEQNGVCSSLRDKQFMCELDIDHPMWTDPLNGHCLEYSQTADYIDTDICHVLIRCALTNGLSKACTCSGNECRKKMKDANCSKLLRFPPEPVFVPFVRTYYDIDTHNFTKDKWPDWYQFVHSIKCRGYQAYVDENVDNSSMISLQQLTDYILLHVWRPFEYIFCENPFNLSGIRRNYSSIDNIYPLDCWNSTYPGKSAVCPNTNWCIPVYSIRDGHPDCPDREL